MAVDLPWIGQWQQKRSTWKQLQTPMILSQLLFCQEQISAKFDRFGWVNQGSKKKSWVIQLSYKTIDFQNLDHRLRYPWLSELQAQEFLFTCMCTKKASWTTIALTIMMQVAARNACLFHLRKGSYKETEIFSMSRYNPSKSFRSFR